MEMRRKERRVTDPVAIREIMNKCEICHIGLVDDGVAYIVPMNFGFEEKDGKYTLFFHGSHEGRKVGLLKEAEASGTKVAFEMETNVHPKTSTQACGHSMYFSSIMGEGIARNLTDVAECQHGLAQIMGKVTGQYEWPIPDAAMSKMHIFCIEVTELMCKESQ